MHFKELAIVLYLTQNASIAVDDTVIEIQVSKTRVSEQCSEQQH